MYSDVYTTSIIALPTDRANYLNVGGTNIAFCNIMGYSTIYFTNVNAYTAKRAYLDSNGQVYTSSTSNISSESISNYDYALIGASNSSAGTGVYFGI